MKMKTVTVSYNVYQYMELSDKAKEVAKQWYLDGQEACFFTEMVEEDLSYILPESDLKVTYSLGYCQGDGLAIYGSLNLLDVLNQVKENFTEKEVKFLKWVLSEYTANVEISCPYRYPHVNYHEVGFVDEFWSLMEYDRLKNVPWKVLERFDSIVSEYMDDLCAQYEKWGYSYFYEVDDETMEDMCSANDYWFTEDGKIA